MLVVVMCKYKTWETFPKNEGLSLRDIKAKFSTEQAWSAPGKKLKRSTVRRLVKPKLGHIAKEMNCCPKRQRDI